jgi:hypothetical protein
MLISAATPPIAMRSKGCSSPSKRAAVSSRVRPMQLMRDPNFALKNVKLTLGLDNKEDDKDELKNQPAAIHHIVPP